ncbi:MAG TPA: hypothetical protein VGB50_02045 [Flavobacterium sp.]
MKRILFCSAFAFSAVFYSCSSSDDASDNLDDTPERYISSMQLISAQDASDNASLTINYDTEGKVTNVSDGTETSIMVYDDSDNLTTVTGESDPFSISELYQAPYDGYEVGEVLDYDNNGNPIKIRLFERDEDDNIIDEYVSDIYYDAKPNPFLHTLNAAGILDVLDNVELNFSSVPTSEEIVMAKLLLPVNNPKRFVIKNLEGEVIEDMVAAYVYDADGYPTSATFTETNSDGTFIYMATYNYLP